jgi:hypothetical protein
MGTIVIDTLRFANRLKAAGVQDDQAEAMSGAFNDELAGGVATKDDLGRAVAELKAEITKVDTKLETQGRYVFLVLALIAALGLYNAVAPHVSGKDPASRSANATEPVAQARTQRPTGVP